jgi:hypothetical protein
MIQSFHRFLLDHLSSEGNTFPHNPHIFVSFDKGDYSAPAAAPITQLLGIDAKNVITCTNCHAIRDKENMTHIVDLLYPRKVRPSIRLLIQESNSCHSTISLATCQRANACHRFFQHSSEFIAATDDSQGDLSDVQAIRYIFLSAIYLYKRSATRLGYQCFRL